MVLPSRCLFSSLLLTVIAIAPSDGFRAASTRTSPLFGRLDKIAPPTLHPSRHPHQQRPSHHVHRAAALATLDALFQSSPYAAAAITCGFKASTADLVAQKRQYRKRNEKEHPPQTLATSGAGAAAAAVAVPEKTPTDVRRNIAFLLYGAVYQGMAQEFIYNHMYPVMFGSGVSVPIVLSKVLFDLLIQTTLVTLPIAYLTKALIYSYSAREAMRRYWDDVCNHGLLKKYYLLWGPVQCITFSIIPEHYRVSFIAVVSFFWLIVLSTIASRGQPKTTEVTVAVDEGAQKVKLEENILECSFEDGLTCNVDG